MNSCKINNIEYIYTKELVFTLLENGTYSVSLHDETIEEIIVPDIYEGKPVTKIDFFGFAGCSNLKRVLLPKTIEIIKHSIFKYSDKVEEIIVDDENKHFKSYEYNLYSKDLKTLILYVNSKNNNKFTVPSFVTTIAPFAFTFKNNVEEVVLNDNLTLIEYSSFFHCKSLRHITLSNKIEVIKHSAFDLCTNLDNIIIPNSVIVIEKAAFKYCENLKNIKFSQNLKEIKEEAFESCSNLDNVLLPDSLEVIEENAFKWCINLLNIYIPTNIKSIAKTAFEKTSIDINKIM